MIIHGRGGEYFGIWAINLLLSIATLGIYSAWAKVRRLRYFYGNTVVDGHALDYHANPIAILKGRLVAAAIIGGFYLAERVYPPAAQACRSNRRQWQRPAAALYCVLDK